MRSEDFVQLLNKLAPRWREQAKTFGLSDEEADDIAMESSVRPRSPTPIDAGDDELLRLINRYDCSRLSVPGGISFRSEVLHDKQRAFVAAEEADPIIIRSDGKVVLLDHASPDFVIAACAANGAAFLDALGILLDVPEGLQRGEHAWRRMTEQCTAAAGGEEYRKFWTTKCAFLADR